MDTPITIFCISRNISAGQKGHFGVFKVWLNPTGIANIISLRTVSSKYWVTYDRNNASFKLHTSRGVIAFIQHCKCFNCINLSNSNYAYAILVNTV